MLVASADIIELSDLKERSILNNQTSILDKDLWITNTQTDTKNMQDSSNIWSGDHEEYGFLGCGSSRNLRGLGSRISHMFMG
jgi:hypothetical protein